GGPTEYYDRLRDPNQWRHVLGERMRDLYADLFAIDTNIQEAPDTEVKGAMARVTGQGDEAVKRYYATFKALASLARFDAAPTPRHPAEEQQEGAAEVQRAGTPAAPDHEAKRRPDFHYNIQIHLPVTTDITVYNAIFRSLRDTLNI
ncbi:MAG TPA: DUF5343 domain-containing protein, partial [Acidobacteriaceae bacterium]|nr:DUF5343 domain-containing protein [Acidobacteriaceae bacterium]